VALRLFGAHHVKVKAAGININLWTGLGMPVLAAAMIAWALARPVGPEPPETRGQGSGPLRRRAAALTEVALLPAWRCSAPSGSPGAGRLPA
jgi:hypothetical protein